MSHTKCQVSRRKLFLCSTFLTVVLTVDGNHKIVVVDAGFASKRQFFFLSLGQQMWLQDKGIYIKFDLYIVLVLYMLSEEMGASTYDILLINGNKKKEASAWHWVVQGILSFFVHFVLSLCFVICFGVLISAKSIIFFVVWNCVSGTKRPPPFVESTCLWLFTLSQTPR